MAAYNSAVLLNQDDSDVTIINHSLLYGHNDDHINSCIPIVRRLQQTSFDNRQDYVYLDQNRLETAEQIQQILSYYRQELKQESNTQLDCSRQLITRLIDFIRPVYSSNKNKMTDLDILFEEIAELHHTRFIEQKEKTEQLNNEISHFKKLIITSTNEDNSSNNTMTGIYRINSMVDYEQWMEMEEETRKLHDLVELQQDRINELIKLISNEDIVNHEKHHSTANLLTRALSNNATKKCSSPLDHNNQNVSLEPKHWECPYCDKTLLKNDEIEYVQHLSLCYNQVIDND